MTISPVVASKVSRVRIDIIDRIGRDSHIGVCFML